MRSPYLGEMHNELYYYGTENLKIIIRGMILVPTRGKMLLSNIILIGTVLNSLQQMHAKILLSILYVRAIHVLLPYLFFFRATLVYLYFIPSFFTSSIRFEQILQLPGHRSAIWGLDVSYDGSFCLTVGENCNRD